MSTQIFMGLCKELKCVTYKIASFKAAQTKTKRGSRPALFVQGKV
jgi:hypothetical protein